MTPEIVEVFDTHNAHHRLKATQSTMSGIFPHVSVAFLALIQTASSAPTGGSNATPAKLCVHLQILIPVVADQYHYDQPQVNGNIDAMDWTVNVTTWDTADFTAR